MTSATYNAANQMTAFGTQTFTYDTNGNLTNDGTSNYVWDPRNRLTSINSPETNANFQYDSVGRRVAKAINSNSTSFLYDGQNPVQELSGNAPTASLLAGIGIDEYFTRSDSSGEHTLLADALASTLALIDNAATVQTQYVYEPFGKTATIGQSSLNSFQYTGRENDGLGIYYYRARYYNPTLQRFISEDPIGFYGGDSNFYAYVRNRPIVWRDPWGTIGLSDIGLPFNSGGPGGYYGGVIGGAVGALLGGGLGPGGAAAGALGVGLLGSHLGGIIDHYVFPCAGQLNCDEKLPPRRRRPHHLAGTNAKI